MFNELKSTLLKENDNRLVQECMIDLVESKEVKDEVLDKMLAYNSADDVELTPADEAKLEKILAQIPEHEEGEELTNSDIDQATKKEDEDDVTASDLNNIVEYIIPESCE